MLALGAVLSSAGCRPHSPPADPAIESSRLLGLGVGVPVSAVVERLRQLDGAVLVQRLGAQPDQLVVTASQLGVGEASGAMLASISGTEPTSAGTLVASLAQAPSTTQVRIGICAGRVWKVAVAHDPGRPVDAGLDWRERFAADRLAFPPHPPAARSEQRASPGGQRWTETRRYQSPILEGALLSESQRMFEPAGGATRSQLMAASIEQPGLCPPPPAV